jgi:hypothetical protein
VSLGVRGEKRLNTTAIDSQLSAVLEGLIQYSMLFEKYCCYYCMFSFGVKVSTFLFMVVLSPHNASFLESSFSCVPNNPSFDSRLVEWLICFSEIMLFLHAFFCFICLVLCLPDNLIIGQHLVTTPYAFRMRLAGLVACMGGMRNTIYSTLLENILRFLPFVTVPVIL